MSIPKPRGNFEDVGLLRRALRAMTMPARRHRCEHCHAVFECHLCTPVEDHSLHYRHGRSPRIPVYCEDCIRRDQLWVTPVAMNGYRPGSAGPDHAPHLGQSILFYDALTGALLGRGCYRRNRTLGWHHDGEAKRAKRSEA